MLIVQRATASKTAELERRRAETMETIKAAVSDLRMKFITPLPGQDAIYLSKEAEAKAYLAADPEPARLAEYPFLAAEAGITAPDPRALAETWVTNAVAWRAVATQIEAIRMAATKAVAAAQSEADLAAAVSALDQGLAALALLA